MPRPVKRHSALNHDLRIRGKILIPTTRAWHAHTFRSRFGAALFGSFMQASVLGAVVASNSSCRYHFLYLYFRLIEISRLSYIYGRKSNSIIYKMRLVPVLHGTTENRL